ncbi:MAG: transposase [Methanobacteriota archaeon]
MLRARVTRGHAHDSPQLKPMVGEFKGDGEPFPADRGHDSEDNYILVKGHGFVPVIKLRKGGPRGLVRREMAESFKLHRDIYQYRGLIEGVVGGTETKYGNRTRCRLRKSRNVDCLLMVVSHNLHTYI